MVKCSTGSRTMGLLYDENAFASHMASRQWLSHGTIVTRRSRFRVFKKWLEDEQLPINFDSISSFFHYLKTDCNLSNTSINTYISMLQSLEKFLVSEGHEPFMDGIQRKTEEEPDIKPLTVEEIKRIVAYCTQNAKGLQLTRQDFTLFLICTGARIEDAQALTCSSIDILGKEVSYRQLKTKRIRTVFIEEPLISSLSKRISGKQGDALVFSNSVGGVLHQPDYHQWLQKVKKATGITKRLSAHIFRHSYAQNHYDTVGDIYLTKDTLGHANIRSTMRYAKNSRKRIRESQLLHPHLDISINKAVKIIENDIEKTVIQRFGSNLDYLQFKEGLVAFMETIENAVTRQKLLPEE